MYTKRPLLTLPLFEKLHDKLRQTAHLPLWSQDRAASLLMNESTTSYIVRCKIRTDIYTDNIWHYKVVNVQQTIDVPTSVNQFTSLLDSLLLHLCTLGSVPCTWLDIKMQQASTTAIPGHRHLTHVPIANLPTVLSGDCSERLCLLVWVRRPDRGLWPTGHDITSGWVIQRPKTVHSCLL